MRFTKEDILQFEKRYRGTFMNSIEGPKNLALIGTQDKAGNQNLAVFNSLVHIGATPPLIGFIQRPMSAPKQTYLNIQDTREYTINLVPSSIIKAAHQSSARYSPEESEFEHVGLTPEIGDIVNAPYVKESAVKFGMQLVEELHIKSNDTLLLIGSVEELFVPDEAIGEDGYVDHAMLETTSCAGLDSYFSLHHLGRFAYAKKDLPVRKIG